MYAPNITPSGQKRPLSSLSNRLNNNQCGNSGPFRPAIMRFARVRPRQASTPCDAPGDTNPAANRVKLLQASCTVRSSRGLYAVSPSFADQPGHSQVQ
ncbi:hypothetical protein EVAR_83398_1 [Eumeta japonica]|uniref:Uncharacterized protein n=1 Tax=Eumeta variegata TaxID=151549 RepID=A0A4C1TYF7_EUMVA|nr:hypothetical protein EVAR_83398_1 [Eumeta japonica]